MLNAHVTFSVAREDRDQALDALMGEVVSVRSMNGCIAFVPFLDPTDPQRLRILHEWQTTDDFAAYTASPGFAKTGQRLHPLIIAPPKNHRFDAEPIGNAN